MRLLIVKLGAIGDVVHALPALDQIRSQLPDIFIGWVVESRAAELLRGNELIDSLIEIDTKTVRQNNSFISNLPAFKDKIVELRDHRFDTTIDMQGLLKSGAIAKLSGAKNRWGFSKNDLREQSSRILLTDTVKIPPKTHIIHKNLILAQNALGLKSAEDQLKFPIFTSEKHKSEASEILKNVSGKFAIINPAGGWPTKLWPAENYGELADRIADELDITPIITHGPNEEFLAQTVLNSGRSGRAIIAKPSLKGFYELARRAAIYIGGDTGPTHIAIAAETPIVGIFGPTEWWRNGSLDPNDICVERTDIPCRIDCHRRSCSNWICMNVSVDTVFSAIKHRLSNRESKASI